MKPKRLKRLFTNVTDSSCLLLQNIINSPPTLLLKQSEELSEENSLSPTRTESNQNSSTEINEKKESKNNVVESKPNKVDPSNLNTQVPKNKIRRVSFNATKELNIIDFKLDNSEHKRQITIPLDLKGVGGGKRKR